MAKLVFEDQDRRDFAELLNAAQTDGVRGVEEVLKDDEFVHATEKASRPVKACAVCWRGSDVHWH